MRSSASQAVKAPSVLLNGVTHPIPTTFRHQTAKHEYEVVGYVLSGRAELEIEGQTVRLEPGDSWVVPAGAEHTYRILEKFTAVEATAPPAEVHGREQS
ncbi:cupin domain-containing protein [Microvirga tunisiensis]|uniref:cupin domain-containing protein n=1 Tax=Microvirga tunisiensis TaxID=2108360 RepID=UPI0030B90657